MARGMESIHFGHVADHAVHIRFPGLHAHDRKDGVHPVVLLAVNRFHVEAVDFENAEDIAVFNHALRDAIAMVPHVVRLFVEREPVEGSEIHCEWVDRG